MVVSGTRCSRPSLCRSVVLHISSSKCCLCVRLDVNQGGTFGRMTAILFFIIMYSILLQTQKSADVEHHEELREREWIV